MPRSSRSKTLPERYSQKRRSTTSEDARRIAAAAVKKMRNQISLDWEEASGSGSLAALIKARNSASKIADECRGVVAHILDSSPFPKNDQAPAPTKALDQEQLEVGRPGQNGELQTPSNRQVPTQESAIRYLRSRSEALTGIMVQASIEARTVAHIVRRINTTADGIEKDSTDPGMEHLRPQTAMALSALAKEIDDAAQLLSEQIDAFHAPFEERARSLSRLGAAIKWHLDATGFRQHQIDETIGYFYTKLQDPDASHAAVLTAGAVNTIAAAVEDELQFTQSNGEQLSIPSDPTDFSPHPADSGHLSPPSLTERMLDLVRRRIADWLPTAMRPENSSLVTSTPPGVHNVGAPSRDIVRATYRAACLVGVANSGAIPKNSALHTLLSEQARNATEELLNTGHQEVAAFFGFTETIGTKSIGDLAGASKYGVMADREIQAHIADPVAL